MARKRKQGDAQPQGELPFSEGGTAGGGDEELLEEGKIICNLTGEHRTATPQEETLQSFIEQLHREYGVAFEDMARDVRIVCESEDPERGGVRKKTRNVSLVVYEPGAAHEPENIIRAVLVAPPTAKADKSVDALEDVLANLDERHDRVFGVWTNGSELAFRMREYHSRTGEPRFEELTDFPAPHETLEDLESAERRPLRIATKDSLLRSFKHCHSYTCPCVHRLITFEHRSEKKKTTCHSSSLGFGAHAARAPRGNRARVARPSDAYCSRGTLSRLRGRSSWTPGHRQQETALGDIRSRLFLAWTFAVSAGDDAQNEHEILDR